MLEIKPLPWMRDLEIVCIMQKVNRNTKMLEIGGGSSTVFFSQFVDSLVTIEHNVEWAETIHNRMQCNLYCKWDLHCIPPDFPQTDAFVPAQPGQFDSYVAQISAEKLGHDSFDIIIIDGRDRVRSAIAATQLMHASSLLFVHDFWNRQNRYKALLNNDQLQLVQQKQRGNRLGVFKRCFT